uniref:Acyltransferase 3 domain-containing protein n=1 Tax=Anopheles epiroticus TaxID=199890 RepID=A0A182PMS1_9DIPT
MNLRHLDGIRALTMMIILLTHSSIPLIRMPLKNVDDLESQFDQVWFPIAMAGNTYTVQIFFVIGGLLLAVNTLEQTKNCIQFAWYLGADFQLYLLGTVLMLLMRIPKLYKPILVCMIVSSFLVPMIVIYQHQLDATVMMILRYVLQEIRTLPYYVRFYIPFETNAGNYFFGMITGIIYHRLKDNPAAMWITKVLIHITVL